MKLSISSPSRAWPPPGRLAPAAGWPQLILASHRHAHMIGRTCLPRHSFVQKTLNMITVSSRHVGGSVCGNNRSRSLDHRDMCDEAVKACLGSRAVPGVAGRTSDVQAERERADEGRSWVLQQPPALVKGTDENGTKNSSDWRLVLHLACSSTSTTQHQNGPHSLPHHRHQER